MLIATTILSLLALTSTSPVQRRAAHAVNNTYAHLVRVNAVRATQYPNVVVTASRGEMNRNESPVIVAVTNERALQAAQAVALLDGLKYQPGLRVETDCQNCGFSQVRMNGLPGSYTQILIDSRPIFSALNGVYGLEQFPTAMIDRIEVVRGGGSALYGANAIAGTINVITRDARTTGADATVSTSWLDGRTPDRSLSVRGSVVADDLHNGVSLFGMMRDRQPYDRNGDGFTEMPLLQNTAGGLRAYHRFSDDDRLGAEAHWLREFRRGGNKLDVPPHEADIAEQLDHSIGGGALTYERFLGSYDTKGSAYFSYQHTSRESYYGSGGGPQAALYYGSTRDEIGIGGLQLNHEFTSDALGASQATVGLEASSNNVSDKMLGYGRQIDQRVSNGALFAQLMTKTTDVFTFLLGGRVDATMINGTYDFGDTTTTTSEQTFVVFNPRISVLAAVDQSTRFRAGFATGFRGPQAFDEDLHTSTLEGTARFVRLAPGLQPERSYAFTLSAERGTATPDFSIQWTLEAFTTVLTDPFITALTNDTLPSSGAQVAEKRNGEPAYVAGANAEVRMVFGAILDLQVGGTAQVSRYTAEGGEVVLPGIRSETFMRSPNLYGYVVGMYTPTHEWTIDATMTITGPMDVQNERLNSIQRSPSFVELNLRALYGIDVTASTEIQLGLGVQNIFNAYQQDLETGASRDGSYVYGPMRPRSFNVYVKASL